ncbi:MAG: carbon-nitrogen hydrolase family protein [Myxococcales bacterium]
MTTTQVAVVQMTSKPDLAHNLESAERLVKRAAQAGAKLVVLPECFAWIGPEGSQRALAESLDGAPGPVLARCQGWAREFGVELILGSFTELTEEGGPRVYNTSVHLGADGSLKQRYRKIHLFDVDLSDGSSHKESASVKAGDTPVVTETALGKLGLSICYDLRFPELYRKLVDLGAVALSVPAAFTLHTGKDHWHVLLQARAIESQSYVLAAAQTGHHLEKRVSYGHAMIVDPWGCILAQCGEGEGIALAGVDSEVVARVRRQVPSLKHRRLG